MLLVSSGGVVLIIIIIVIIASIFGSALGFLFSNETPQTEENIPISSAIDYLEKELEEKITTITQDTDYDTLEVKNKDVAWKEVLTIYAVITTNRETNFNIMQMDKQNYQKLSEIFWNVVEVEHYTETYKVKVVTTNADGNKVVKTKTKIRLIIDAKAMSLEEMMEYYDMSTSERKQVEEMTSSQFDGMWEKIELKF